MGKDYTKLIRDHLNMCLPKEMWIGKSKGGERSENGERFPCYFIIMLSSALLSGLYLRYKLMPSEPSFLNPFSSIAITQAQHWDSGGLPARQAVFSRLCYISHGPL